MSPRHALFIKISELKESVESNNNSKWLVVFCWIYTA